MNDCKLRYILPFLKEDGLSGYRMANDAVNFTDPVFGECFAIGSGKDVFATASAKSTPEEFLESAETDLTGLAIIVPSHDAN